MPYILFTALEYETVYDLPQIHTHPTYSILMKTLELLKLQPTTFSSPQASHTTNFVPRVSPEGIPRYLTSIISSPLTWLDSDDDRESIWEAASLRLSERSGRSAMPSMTRSFRITDELTINLYEPSLTEDNLGLKTWTSSLLLAKRLSSLRRHVPERCERVLELGSGTGLVGIAAAVLWDVHVLLTDLPEIVGNLRRNVEASEHLLESGDRQLSVRALDWANEEDLPVNDAEKFDVVVVADPIYSAEHPRLLVDALKRWIVRSDSARFIVELPLREGYKKERQDLRQRLAEDGLVLVEEDTEIGYDDWLGPDGRPAEVECWWSVWRFTTGEETVTNTIRS